MKKQPTEEERALADNVLRAVRSAWKGNDVFVENILGHCRATVVSDGRQACYYLLRRARVSWHTIGKLMGKGHQPCLVGARRIEIKARIHSHIATKIRDAAQSAGIDAGL